MRILFVCTGNTCRSPMAEGLLKHKMPQATVQSAGIFAMNDQRPNQHAIDVMKQRGISLNVRSQPVTYRLLHEADVILTMTTQHKQSLILEYPQFQDKYFMLKEYVSFVDDQLWQTLKQRYADFADKRSSFIQENEHKMDNHQLDHELDKYLQDDWEEIQQLEYRLIDYNISDPFGGNLADYAQTARELEKCIDALVNRLDHA